jgi:hypothetical protein
MDRHGVDAGELDSGVLDVFLADHVDRYGHLPSAGVMPLLDHLRVWVWRARAYETPIAG